MIFKTKRGVLILRGYDDYLDQNRYPLPILSITWSRLFPKSLLIFRGFALCWWSWAFLVYYSRPTWEMKDEDRARWQDEVKAKHRHNTGENCWLCHKRIQHREDLEDAVQSLLIQFAYDANGEDGPALMTGGLSALEEGFSVLKWEDPHPIPWAKCEHPDCKERATCGTPTSDGYKRCCGTHYREYQHKDPVNRT